MPQPLSGRVALVTGGARRVGRAIASALAGAGATVAVHYRSSRSEAEDLCVELGRGAFALHADLSEAGAARELVRAAHRRASRLDILVNNASTFAPTPLDRLTLEQWDECLRVNLGAPVMAAVEAGRVLADGGVIVNLTDASVWTPWPSYLAYQVAKAGLTHATAYLARALAPRLRVNAVAPGPVLLPEDASEAESARATARVPLARLGSPEDVARAVLYLATADYVTGVVLPVDGGRRLG